VCVTVQLYILLITEYNAYVSPVNYKYLVVMVVVGGGHRNMSECSLTV